MSATRAIIIGVVGLVSWAAAVGAATITVRRDGSGDFAVLQPALDAAAPGDTIDVGPGEYRETTTVRLPNYYWDIDIYAHVTVDNLTIIGAGINSTSIGPVRPNIDFAHYTPQGIYAASVQTLTLRDLCLRHTYVGLHSPQGRTDVRNCWFKSHNQCLRAPCTDVLLENSLCESVGADPRAVAIYQVCQRAVVRGCTFRNGTLHFENVGDGLIEDCEFSLGMKGVRLDGWGTYPHCTIRRCTFDNVSFMSLLSIYGTHVVSDIAITGGEYGVFVGDSDFTLTTSVISGTTSAAFWLSDAESIEIHDSDLLPGGGWAVKCSPHTPPGRTYDLSGNYWGTTDPAAIAALIWDALDSAAVSDTVNFLPFAGESTPAVPLTWGAVKSTFR